MHERTQTALLRLAFVSCCALPTSLTLLAILATWTPWYHRGQLAGLEAEWTQRLGLRVEITDFARPAPGALRLQGVRVLEPETGLEVARVRQIDFADSGEKMAMVLHQPELRSAQLPFAWRIVHDRFLCQPNLTVRSLRAAAMDLTIHSKTGGVTLRDVQAWVAPSSELVLASIAFVPAGRSDDAPAKIHVTRDRSGPQPVTRWEMDTGGTPLPCSAIAEYLPAVRRLGSAAQFTGSLAWTLSRDGWSVDLGGAVFREVDLGDVFERLPHKLTGTATLRLQRCEIDPGQTVSISGSLVAVDGYAGDSLLRSVQQHLGLQRSTGGAPSGGDENVLFDLLALHFEIDGPRLRLSGQCHHQRGYERYPRGVVLVGSGGRPLLQCVEETTQQALSLLLALAPSHGVRTPVSQQTAGMLNFLLPPSRPLADDMPPPAPRISLRDP